MCCACSVLHIACIQITDLASRELVPGDVVELHVGDKVPADIRVCHLKTATVRAEQSSLTGESVAVQKQREALPYDLELELQVSRSSLGPQGQAGPRGKPAFRDRWALKC